MIKEMSLELLDRCLLRCKHCSTEAGIEGKKSLDKDTVYSVIRQAKVLGLESLSFSGGEPFLYEDFWDVVCFARNLNISIKVYTSGVIEQGGVPAPIDLPTSLKLSKLVDKVIVSIHGPTSSIHDEITCLEGSFDITLKSIIALKEFNTIEVHTVPMKVNLFYLGEVVHLCESLGIQDISFLRLVPQGRCLENPEILMDNEDYRVLHSVISGLNPQDIKIRKGSPFRCLFLDQAGKCTAAKNKLMVSPDGGIFPCEAFKSFTAHSNVKKVTLVQAWENDPLLVGLRNIACISECDSCPYYRTCFGGCPGQRLLVYQNFNQGPDPACQFELNRHSCAR